jgi:hypothetical protein
LRPVDAQLDHLVTVLGPHDDLPQRRPMSVAGNRSTIPVRLSPRSGANAVTNDEGHGQDPGSDGVA